MVMTGGYDVWPRAELERAIASCGTVPVRLGDRIIGQAHLSVDDTGLRFTLNFGSQPPGPSFPISAPFPMMEPLSLPRSLALRCAVHFTRDD